MKCLYCGKTILLGRIKLADGYIHASCFRKLGFDSCFDQAMDDEPFDKIKDGYDAYVHNNTHRHYEEDDDEFDPEELAAAKKKIVDDVLSSIHISVSDYGQERDLICTEEEREIYARVCGMLEDTAPRLVRTSKDYVTIKYGDYDLLRLKYTNRSKWLVFPMLESGSVKHYIDGLEDLEDYRTVIEDSLAEIKRFSGE